MCEMVVVAKVGRSVIPAQWQGTSLFQKLACSPVALQLYILQSGFDTHAASIFNQQFNLTFRMIVFWFDEFAAH